MSKNLTRKGLALGAVVALGASLFAGAPAFAAGKASSDFTLAPNAGTTYNSIAGSTFDLASTITTGAVVAQYGSTSALANLSFLVTNADANSIDVGFDGAAGAAADGSSIRTGASAAAADLSATSDTTDSTVLTAKAIVVRGKVNNGGVSTASALKNHLQIKSDSAAASNVVVGVTAFIDENGNGVIDSTDLVSPAVTVTFIPAANVTATTTISSAVVGTNTITAKVVLGGDVNMASLGGSDVKVGFTLGGTKLRVTNVSAASVDTTDASFDGVDSLTTGARRVLTSQDAFDTIGAGTYVAQAYYGTTKIGSASSSVVTANGTVTSVDAIDSVSATNSANVSYSSNATTVKTGYQGAISFKTTVKNTAAAAAVAIAGIPVRVTLSKVALDAGSTFTVGSAVLTATSGSVTYNTTTNADGTVTFTGSGTGAKGDSVNVAVSVLKSSGGYLAATTNVVTFADAAAATLINTDLVNNAGQLKNVYGSSFTVNYAIVDQFGQPFTGARRLKLTNNGGTAVFAYYPVFAGGKASQTIVDNATAAGQITVAAQLQKLDTTGAWVNDTSLTVADLVVNDNTKVATAVSATSSAGSASVNTITKPVATADLNIDANTVTATSIGYSHSTADKSTISGYATDASGAAVAGQVVTLSGAGLGFLVGNVYTVGTAKVTTGSDGYYAVDVFGNTAGAAVITITAGSATNTAKVTFAGVTLNASTNKISVDAPALSQVGRSFTVTVKVVDQYGNPVSGLTPTVSVTGVGSVTTAAATDKTGATTVQFVAGANDFGDAVITAQVVANDSTAATLTASKTVTVGVTDAQVDLVGNRVTAVASFSKGKTVAFYVDGIKKWSKASTSDADVVINSNLKKGTHTVTVKISGGFVTTEKFIVK